jgi:hypothetical protein
MIRIVGVQRADDANVVNALAQLRQQLTDRQAALAAGLERIGNGHQAAGGILGAKLHFGGPLARVLVQLRLGIEQVGLERAAVHEKLDHALGARGKMRLPGRFRAGCYWGGGDCFVAQHLRKAHCA